MTGSQSLVQKILLGIEIDYSKEPRQSKNHVPSNEFEYFSDYYWQISSESLIDSMICARRTMGKATLLDSKLVIKNAFFDENFAINGENIPYELSFVNCWFPFGFSASGSCVERIKFQDCVINGDVTINNLRITKSFHVVGTIINGCMISSHSMFGRDLRIENSAIIVLKKEMSLEGFDEHAPVAIDLSYSSVGRSFMGRGMIIENGSISAHHISISGDLNFTKSTLNVDFHDKFVGKDSMLGLIGIDVRDSTIKGNLRMIDFQSNGELNGSNIIIGGNLYIKDSEFLIDKIIRKPPYASKVCIILDRARISGFAEIISSQFNGKLAAFHTKVGANLIFKKILNEDNQVFIDLRSMLIDGSIYFDNCVLKGSVDLSAIKVENGVYFRKSVFEAKFYNDEVIIFQKSIINGELIFYKSKFIGKINYNHASSDGFFMDGETFDNSEGEINSVGFNYSKIGSVDGAPAPDWIEWLHRANANYSSFERMAKVFSSYGHHDYAKKIKIEKERVADMRYSYPEITRMLSKGNFQWIGKFVVRKLYGLLMDYGYNSKKIIIFSVVIIFISSVFYEDAFNKGLYKAVKSPSSSEWAWNNEISDTYPTFDSFVHSIDVFLPVGDFKSKQYWVPKNNSLHGKLCWWVQRIESFFGWLLATLILAAWSGLIKKE